MQNKVKEYIHHELPLHDNSKIIVGVSGGADSMALLHILIRLGYNCIAAHCNFHLRGEESDRDYLFVKNWCIQNNIRFVYTDFDTKKYMKEKAVSLEMAARELRYEWFEQIRKEHNANVIAVAHHQDDSIETLLINLIRGTGIRGLSGIPPVNGNIVRPLLCLYRQEILEYLQANHIDFIEDSTNNEDIYTRNKIRLNVIPLLETINPSAKQAISKTIKHLSSTEKIYTSAIEKSIQCVFSDNKIDIGSLLTQIEPKTVLFEILHPYGFNSENITDIFESLHGQSGKIFYSKDYVLIKDRESLILSKQEQRDDSRYTIQKGQLNIDSPVPLSIEYIKNDTSLQIEKKPDTIYLDKSKLSFPLTIRRWMQGDKFVPFGMNGSKKISDYFSDNKFNLIEKENVWLLCSGNKIVWIIGERADNRFRITGNTSEIIKISLT